MSNIKINMRILYLCKRHYMGHDVIADRYARLYEQPFQLAQLGSNVLGVCLSYRNCTKIDEVQKIPKGKLRWVGLSANKHHMSVLTYPFTLLKIAREFKPDIVVGASDCLHIILGEWLSKKLGCVYAVDLYDDFETFGLAKIPFIKMLYRKALKKAKVISCVSQSLKVHIKKHSGSHVSIIALPSTIDQSIFHPRDKNEMRVSFNLPINAPIIGTAGGLFKNKGIETVYKAFEEVLTRLPDVICVFAGPIDANYPPPKHERIIYLGKLSHERVAELFCVLDVGIVYLKDTQYGQLSFPQKAYEMAACQISMVVANVGDMR
ncbi:MAG: group 1 glycosyl transferase, partial [Chitinophagaceae bacterium]